LTHGWWWRTDIKGIILVIGIIKIWFWKSLLYSRRGRGEHLEAVLFSIYFIPEYFIINLAYLLPSISSSIVQYIFKMRMKEYYLE
jgi:hypothetical protein